ncbi:MAG TPA: YbaK/EbsC family protein [Candidatus Eisenbacteria bacterium]|jgi:prolyl-tRNA editing enzyme YbaK/EbsC (Cys-tRNA(Pro) deacylase)
MPPGPPLLDLAAFLLAQGLKPELVSPGVPMPTVGAAAAAMGCPPDQIFKSVLFHASDGRCILVIACGDTRVDLRKVEALTGFPRLRLARPDVVLERTGYPAGGTPPVGHREPFPVIVDARVAAREWGWAGGGRPELLVRMRSADIVRLNGARIEDVVAPGAAGE